MNDRRVIEQELAALGEPPLDDREVAEAALAPGVVDVSALFGAAHGSDEELLDDLARARVWRSVSGRMSGSSRRPVGLWIGSALAVAAAALLIVTAVRPLEAVGVASSDGLRAEATALKAAAAATLAALDRGDGHESRRADKLARRYAARLGKEAG